MPKRNPRKGYAGVWYLDSTVPGSDPPQPDRVYYITYRISGERKSRDEKIGRDSDRVGRAKKAAPRQRGRGAADREDGGDAPERGGAPPGGGGGAEQADHVRGVRKA